MQHFESISRNMMITDKYFKLYLRDALAPYGLNAPQGVVLLMLYHNAAVKNTQEDLIRRIHYDKGVMTRTMKELEQKGLVKREPHPSDSRSYLFSLTESGAALHEPMMDILRQWNEKLLVNISEQELAALKTALETMAKNACAASCDEQA